jgi:hypothetical protein
MFKSVVLLICSTALAAGAWLVSAPRANPSAPLGGGSVLEMHRQLFAAIDRGEIEAVKAFVSDSRGSSGGSVFLVDFSGAPVQAWGTEGVRELLARTVAHRSKRGGEWKTTITKEVADCHSPELSYAVLEFERARVVDGKSETKRFRSTSLVCNDGGKWKLFHWHVSPMSEPGTAVAQR